MTSVSVPRVIIRQTACGFVLRNERNTKLSAFLKGKPIVVGQTMLTSLMGLCPIAHREAFDTACYGRGSQMAGYRLVIEAMLETVRVYLVDWSRFVDESINRDTLAELGHIRQRLFAVLTTQNEQDVNGLFVDTQRFVREFQITYARLQESLLKSIDVFDSIPSLDSEICLAPSCFNNEIMLGRLLDNLRRNSEFSIQPSLDGSRLLGAVARREDLMEQPISLKTLLDSRWFELSRWSRVDFEPKVVFDPYVCSLDDGWSVATVETARGTLMQAVKVNGDNLEDFHVIAPTEWVFQPQGALVEMIDRFVDQTNLVGQELLKALNFLVALFDACTDVQVVLGDNNA